MDPDANLERILKIIKTFRETFDAYTGDMQITLGETATVEAAHITIKNSILSAYDWNDDPVMTVDTTTDLIEISNALSDSANELVDLMDGLHGWLSTGGFLPMAWRRR